ncbi:chaperone SurA [Geomonas limicola]|uniref:Chaperone SurA n=1 Tax=Geomonas limicola TaxID=2740186 RepID=A0A6V8N8S8_9BACT|nr:peptidylprolyl isomerase [Geomonas limicola]GFO67719.1 chaperone SurA [Geomonas limicola]
MVKIRTGIIALALALTPALAPAQVIDSIAAVVNDELITTHELDREYQQLQKEQQQLPASEKMGLRTAALNRLIDKKLIDQKVRELDVKVLDDEVKAAIEDVKKQNRMTQEQLVQALAAQGLSFDEYRRQLREQLERLRLMSQEVRSKIQVGDQEVQDYYNANLARYGAIEQFRARHIFFKVDKKGGAAELAKVEAHANEVLKEAQAGKNFVELAKKYSDDPAAAKDGGDLGTFKRSDMLAEIGDTVAAMKPGEVSNLVMSQAGLHIIKLEEKGLGQAKPLAEVKNDIEELLFKKKADERFTQWLKDLRTSVAVDIRQ